MVTKNYVIKNKYYDSVMLMKLAGELGRSEGVTQLTVGMGTPLNKDTMNDLNLLLAEGREASPNDLIIAVEAESDAVAERLRETYLGRLKKARGTGKNEFATLDIMGRYVKDRNLAVISLAGEFAGMEAKKALQMGMDVFMFSDNVPIEQEIELKTYARDHGLLMMGPDCGLSFINGVAVGLCSKVRRGKIGIAAACGSGMQEVMNIVHRHGFGISHAIGVGGRDLQDAVGGITMLQSMDILESDPDTAVIVLISKPPQPNTIEKILARVRVCQKPVVVQFINADLTGLDLGHGAISDTFENTANLAIALSQGKSYSIPDEDTRYREVAALAEAEAGRMAPEQKYLRGIYCGGSLAEETLTLAQFKLGPLYGNIAFSQEYMLADPTVSVKDCMIDIGAETFTIGRPHVAIDPAPRIERFLQEARDPETAVILMDFLLGYALCDDPAGMMVDVIRQGKAEAEAQGRYLSVIASICGSDLDPQNFDVQKKLLEDCGVIVMENNGAASRLAASIIAYRRERQK